MKNKISIAIIGAGKMSREYIKVFLHKKKFQIKGVIGRSKKNLNLLSKEFPNLLFTNNINQVFKKQKIDLTIICVLESEILNVTKLISKFQTTILFEKPVGVNFLETKKIMQIVKKNKIKSFVALNRRFYQSTLLGKKLIGNKKNKKFIFVNDSQSEKKMKKIKKFKKIYKNIMYCNSIHLIDYFNIFGRGKIIKIKNYKKFKSLKPTRVISLIYFSSGDMGLYHARWDKNEKWEVSIFSKKIAFSFKPLEIIKIFKNVGDQKIKKNYNLIDIKYKAGLFEISKELQKFFEKKKNNLIDLNEYFKTVMIIKKIYQK